MADDPSTSTDDSDTGKSHGAPSSEQTDLVVRVPSMTCRWSPEEVIPDNGRRPDEAIAEMHAETEYPENRPKASIVAWRADNNAKVLTVPLSLVDKNLIDANNAVPTHAFTLDDNIWDDYDKLLYHFTGTVDSMNQDTSTPLKVKRWHVQGVNNKEVAAIKAFRTQEIANFNAVFAGLPDDAHESWGFDAGATAKADFGDMMRNTYSFNYTGHGGVICGECNNLYKTITATGPDYGKWTTCKKDATHDSPISAHCVDAFPWTQAPDISNVSTVEHTPKYLMYSVCCGGAFEPGLYNAYLTRGTRYALGFKRSTRCDWARDYTNEFFKKWVGDHGCNPDRIPEVFDSLSAKWDARLEPTLFGPPAPQGLQDAVDMLQGLC